VHSSAPKKAEIGTVADSDFKANVLPQLPIVRSMPDACCSGRNQSGEPAMREMSQTEIAAVSGGIPERLRYDAIAFEAPETESATDYFSELMNLSRGLRADMDFI
jgi:hypothetical protein